MGSQGAIPGGIAPGGAVWWNMRLTDALVIPPYGSMVGILSLLCLSFCLFFLCTITDFSAAEKARGVKFCMSVGLLSGQVFSPFGEHWLARSHEGGGLTNGMNVSAGSCASEHGMGIRNWRLRRCLRPYGGIYVLQAC